MGQTRTKPDSFVDVRRSLRSGPSLSLLARSEKCHNPTHAPQQIPQTGCRLTIIRMPAVRVIRRLLPRAKLSLTPRLVSTV